MAIGKFTDGHFLCEFTLEIQAMRMILVLLAGLTVALSGCGKDEPIKVEITAETEAEQKRSQEEAQQAEMAHRKTQKPEKSFEQNVEEAESSRRR